MRATKSSRVIVLPATGANPSCDTAVPSRTIGDHQAEYVALLGLMAATCSKIAREIYTHLERIVDAFEDVADEIDGIVIDHA